MENTNFITKDEAQDELLALIDQNIEEQLSKTMGDVAQNPDHKEDVGEMHRLLDACLQAHHAARHYTYIYIHRTQDNFFEKGFWAGVEFSREMHERLDGADHSDAG